MTRPSGSWTSAPSSSPPSCGRSASSVPSPPSATGHRSGGIRPARSSPRPIALATWAALNVPLKESGAIRTGRSFTTIAPHPGTPIDTRSLERPSDRRGDRLVSARRRAGGRRDAHSQVERRRARPARRGDRALRRADAPDRRVTPDAVGHAAVARGGRDRRAPRLRRRAGARRVRPLARRRGALRRARAAGGLGVAAPDPLAQQLIDQALGGRLVLAPARDLGPVPDPVVARVIELDLDDDLGPELDPLELAVSGPAGRVAHPSLAGLVRSQPCRQLALLLRRES